MQSNLGCSLQKMLRWPFRFSESLEHLSLETSAKVSTPFEMRGYLVLRMIIHHAVREAREKDE